MNAFRRSFLKQCSLSGLGGLYLSPLLQRVGMAADGTSRARPRFVFVVEGNGLPPIQLHPTNLPFVERQEREVFRVDPLVSDALPVSLRPVAAFVDRLAIVQGLNGEVCGGGHSTSHGALGAYNTRDGKVVHDATVDSVLGRTAGTIFENVVLGISAEDRDVIFNCSATGPNQSSATFCKPEAARQRLFGPLFGAAGARRQSLLIDYLREDVRKAREQLAGPEREKLDAYLDAYEGIRLRDERAKAYAGQNKERLDRSALTSFPLDESPEGKLTQHFELAATTLIAGLSDVVTIASGVGFRHFNIHFSKLATQSKHVLGHAIIDGSQQAIAEAEAIRAFHFGLIAQLMQRLQAVPEGDGSMLDQTVIVYLSDAANSHHTKCEEWPLVLLGGTPRLRLGGRYLVYPNRGQVGWRTINTLHNTLLHLAGTPRDDFGHRMKGVEDAVQKGPLEELLV